MFRKQKGLGKSLGIETSLFLHFKKRKHKMKPNITTLREIIKFGRDETDPGYLVREGNEGLVKGDGGTTI